MVVLNASVLDSGSGNLVLAWVTVLCSQARHVTLAVPLSSQVNEWLLANLMVGVNPLMDYM